MKLIYLVIAMALVTYIPRMLPMVLLQNVKLPVYVKAFMKLIPYAALGALIFPGALTSAGPEHLNAAIIGCSLAILLAWFGTNLILVVAGGIAGSFIINFFF
ncbi:MAG: AzlD domain-containing protein [Acidaminococcaceae bacterium]